MTSSVVMVGPMPEEPGGITGVVDTLFAGGLRELVSVEYVGLCPFGRSFSRWIKLQKYVRNGFPLAVTIIFHRVAVMHFNVSHGVSLWRKLPLIMLAVLMRVPTILHIHSGRFFERKGIFWRPAILRYLLEAVDCVVVLSDIWVTAARSWAPRARVEVIYNPVHIRTLPPRPEPDADTPFRVLYMGRIIPSKGVYDLLDAVPTVLSKIRNTEFWVAGNGETDEFEASCRRRGLTESVRFIGWQGEKDKPGIFRMATLFVHPSHFEGFGRTVAEAMAAGLPVVTTTAGALPDIIRSGENGLLVQPGNPPELAAAIITLLRDKQSRREMSIANRKKAEQLYSAHKITKRWHQLYHELGNVT